ncbi:MULTISPECIES: DUF642 domain-containing protein [Pseudoalteromonas]|uniref:DUF642 domain-containing protein n=1 Tax=Pseudoalteromonas TaxID=53246 RepID=UPI0006CA3CCD|nr:MULTISPECIES: DUF642 domain-containing protein [Pseudoalteromonas]KPM79344.1 hemolysin-type calcium-binding protein [Pseudoalteromonas sp. UCD-33C]MCG9736119.1 DUF642 domain-containing protein [Pseudoalteromonas shioyasakiensis]URQ85321.1 DUF642 domain-containing protein [Pseudoalteromonas sp. SCSIO 43088]
MKSLVTKLAILPLAIASTIAMAGTNLVENGSFENTDTVTDHNGQWQLFDVIPGWTRSTNAKFEIQTNKLGIVPAQDGEQLIELDSTANYSISQAIATTAGNQYEVSFYYSARVTGNEQTNKAEVFWNSESLAVVNSSTKGWTKYSFTVEADSASSVLSFAGAGTSDSVGAFIDNVVVTEIPAPCAVVTGLYGINNFGSETEGYVYHFNPESSAVTVVAGLNNTASNIASKDGMLYFMEQLDKSSKASKIYSLDLATDTQAEVADATSFPIYRSTVTADGLSLRATSKTYMYDFDLTTGEKTVLGKLSYEGDSFSDGDIAYSSDYNVLYVLTGKALYTLDEGSLELTQIGEHGVNWASGIAIADDGTIYISGRESGENAKIYTLDQNTAEATFVMDGPAHVNDLTFVSEAVCAAE